MQAKSRKVVDHVTLELTALEAQLLQDACKFLRNRGSESRRTFAVSLLAVLEQVGVLDHGMDECLADFFKEAPSVEG